MLPLILAYRLRHYAPNSDGSIFLGVDTPEYSNVKPKALKDAERLAAAHPNLFQVVREGPRDSEVCLMVAPGEKPTLYEMASELVDSGLLRSAAQMELITAVLARGDMPGTYGNSYWGGEVFDVLHLVVCGPDWSKFEGVTSERWREWGGTFHEDTYEDRLEVALKCRCDELFYPVQFGLRPPSLAKLFVSLEAGSVEKLFDV